MAHAGTLAEDLESEVWDADGLSHNLCQSTPAVGLILLEPILSGRSSLQTLHVVGERPKRPPLKMAWPKRPWPKRPSPKRPRPKRPWPKRPSTALARWHIVLPSCLDSVTSWHLFRLVHALFR